MKNNRQVLGPIVAIATMWLLLGGCTTNWQEPPPAEHSKIQRDPLSYGAVTAKVRKDETTQEEIMRLFGAPNITTMNKNGEEVWMYDRISSTTQSDGWSEAQRFSTFFGLKTFSAKQSSRRGSTTSTLTVIITFDPNKRVKDYSTRATQF